MKIPLVSAIIVRRNLAFFSKSLLLLVLIFLTSCSQPKPDNSSDITAVSAKTQRFFLDILQYVGCTVHDSPGRPYGNPKLISDGSGAVWVIYNQLISFVPGHPIAGLEKSGPENGFTELFSNRFCILTPINNNNSAVEPVKKMWETFGMRIEYMKADHHDRVLAMTSHIPQLIAYSIVATATELEDHIKNEVIKYSAAGFRDFTRLLAANCFL